MTSLIKPDDSERHAIQKNIYMAFLGHLLCPSLDKAKRESVYLSANRQQWMASPGWKRE